MTILFDGMMFDAILSEKDIATNRSDETGRYRMLLLNQWEHDDPEQAPTYQGQPLIACRDERGTVVAWVERELEAA